MIANIVLALIIWLFAKGIVIFPDPTVNFITWAVIVFVVAGIGFSQMPADKRNYWIW
jgi:hypothetical protein